MYIAPFQVRDLEAELEAEQRRHREASAAARKFERQLKELMVQSDEDRRMITDLTEQVAMLTQKIKVYKRQVEEAVSFTKGHNVTHCLPSATVLCECAALDNHCIFFKCWYVTFQCLLASMKFTGYMYSKVELYIYNYQYFLTQTDMLWLEVGNSFTRYSVIG